MNMKDEANEKENKGETPIKRIEIIVGIVAVVVGVIISLISLGLDLCKYVNQMREEEIAEKEAEKKGHPQMYVLMGDVVIRGGQRYQTIYLINNNDEIEIESGIMKIHWYVMVEHNDKKILSCDLDNVIYNSEPEYLPELDGNILLVRENYQEFPEIVENFFREQGMNSIDEMVFQSYLFIYYQYACEGKNMSGYYKVKIDGGRCGAVEEISDQEHYFDVFVMTV